jgi:hypothetical protein
MYALASWWNVAAAVPAGQGLLPSRTPPIGASNTLKQLQQQYRNSEAWKHAYKQKPSAACGPAGGATLCAAQGTSATDAYAQLTLATSPQAYSSTHDSKLRIVAPAQDQAECQTCTAFAVAAAAETAMASALQVDVNQCSISAHALFFCAQDGPAKSCDTGWSLENAVEQLKQRSRSLPTAACMPYRPDITGDRPAAALCKGNCNNPNMHASKGQFSTQRITSVWRAQQQIRRHGAVVSRFDVSMTTLQSSRVTHRMRVALQLNMFCGRQIKQICSSCLQAAYSVMMGNSPPMLTLVKWHQVSSRRGDTL